MQVKDIQVKAPVAPAAPKATAAKAKAPAPAQAPQDRFVATQKDDRKAPPSPSAKVPGEDVRNSLSIAGQIAGPIVTAKQTIGMLAKATFKSPLLAKAAHFATRSAGALGKLPLFRSPALATGLKWVGRGLPFLGAAILAFDGFAFFKTILNPEASGMRKFLTSGRFLFNAIATAVSFIPGAGFVYSLAPALVGNVFEYGLMKQNADEAKQAAK